MVSVILNTRCNADKKSVRKSGFGHKSSSRVKYITKAKHLPSAEQEVAALRARNKVLEAAFKSIQNCAKEHFDKRHDLVWFAKNRLRFPNHEKSKRLETSEEHSDDINKLRSRDADYFHGMNCGILATSRLFKEITDLSSILDSEENKMIQNHDEKVKTAKECFPNIDVN